MAPAGKDPRLALRTYRQCLHRDCRCRLLAEVSTHRISALALLLWNKGMSPAERNIETLGFRE